MLIKDKKGSKEEIIFTLILAISILLIIGSVIFAIHINKKLSHETYQNVVSELSGAERCLYQCGFLYPQAAAFENYKFCTEKCDRIHERQCSGD